jgi:2-polyprenyl-3-methyl-5-hydroxy-6-metoxy-1,4-benzoquinol methylase
MGKVKDYTYTVSSSNFAKKFMQELAISIECFFSENKEKLNIIEIGSGDGQQLLALKKRGHNVLGVEPSETLTKIALQNGIKTIQRLFEDMQVSEILDIMPQVDVVLMTYTLDHIPNTSRILQAIKALLETSGGKFIFENHDFDKILYQREFCLFEHEHSIYLNAKTAKYVLNSNGFKLLDINWLPDNIVRANSLLVASTPSKNSSATLSGREKKRNIRATTNIENLFSNSIRNFDKVISEIKKQDYKVAGYGAGGRGVMTLAAILNYKDISFVIDKNTKDLNKYTPKTHLKVVPIEYLEKNPVDYIIVFSFGYIDEIREDLKRYGYSSEKVINMIEILKGKYTWKK